MTSIFVIEMNKVGKVAGYVEVRGMEMSLGWQDYLVHNWAKHDPTAMVWKQTDVYILTICNLQRTLLKP
jgi:predicted alpha-1,6-mannanase (GH76 family)